MSTLSTSIIFLFNLTEEMKPLKEKLRSLSEVESNFSGVRDKRNTAVANLDNARERIEELQEKLRDFGNAAEKRKSDEEIERTRAKMVKEKAFKARDIEAKTKEVRELGEGLREAQSKKNSLAATLGELKTRQQQFADWQAEFARR